MSAKVIILYHRLGLNICRLEETPSTNAYARQLAAQGPVPDGTVVITRNQTNGRGQADTSWESEPGKNLTLTLVINPVNLKAEEHLKLNTSIALAVYDLVREKTGEEARIKWPNDIYAGSKKVCGILVENVLAGPLIRQSFIGIGLNVNQVSFGVQKAASLSSVTGHTFDPDALLEELLAALEKRLQSMYLLATKTLLAQYNKVLYRLNLQTDFREGDRQWSGIVLGADETGRLNIGIDGTVRTFDHKEVEWLR